MTTIKRPIKKLFKDCFFYLLVFILMTISTLCSASDTAKEKRWSDQVIDSLMDGEAVYLNNGKQEFLVLDMPPEEGINKKAAETGVIIMHGIGVHPNWAQIIQPVRIRLSEAGWHTLSIQMPVLENEAGFNDYLPLMDEVAPRIEAAIVYLKKAGVKKIVLIGHSLGTYMASYYLANRHQQQESPVISYIGISMLANNTKLLKGIQLPVLDLFGSDDLKDSISSVPDRLAAASDNKKYQQIIIDGADHFFAGKEDELLAEIEKWLLNNN